MNYRMFVNFLCLLFVTSILTGCSKTPEQEIEALLDDAESKAMEVETLKKDVETKTDEVAAQHPALAAKGGIEVENKTDADFMAWMMVLKPETDPINAKIREAEADRQSILKKIEKIRERRKIIND